MSWLRLHRRSAFVCLTTFALVLLAYAYLLSTLWGVGRDAQAEAERLEPRISRMLGLMGKEVELAEVSGQAELMLSDYVYPATGDETALAAAVQANVRQILTQAGLSISKSQVMQSREQGEFSRVGLRITASGELEALDTALAEIAQFRPVLLIESLEVWPTRQVKGAENTQVLSTVIQLFALRGAQ